MKTYKNGALVGTETNAHEPLTMTRSQHHLGRRRVAEVFAEYSWYYGTDYVQYDTDFFEGSIAFVRMWHGVELEQSEVTALYDERENPALSFLIVDTATTCEPGFGLASNGACEECGAGKASTGASCEACPAGTHANAAMGADECVPCPAGFFGTVVGSASADDCQACETGTMSLAGATGSFECEGCVAGKYMDGRGVCTECTAGKYSAVLAATSADDCQVCESGKASAGGAISCATCEAGTHAGAAIAASQCTNCAAGRSVRVRSCCAPPPQPCLTLLRLLRWRAQVQQRSGLGKPVRLPALRGGQGQRDARCDERRGLL